MMTEAGDHYTLWQMFWYLGGFLLWGVAYAILVVRIPRHEFVEIPFFAVCGNVTWEFLWGFVWHVEMLGGTLQWFYRLGCLLDVGILTCVFLYGSKQVSLPALKRSFAPIVVASLAFWLSSSSSPGSARRSPRSPPVPGRPRSYRRRSSSASSAFAVPTAAATSSSSCSTSRTRR